MFTMRLTARSCPTIFPKSRRSKSSTAGLRISGSRSTSSETNGLTIALHLLPVFPSLCQESLESASTLQSCKSPANQIPAPGEFDGSPLHLVGMAVLMCPYRHVHGGL